jgi:gas vesicle protein
MTVHMANASPEAQRPDDPALAVASKRIVTLEADISNLRKGMVQQLTVSGKLIKAVFALDDDYFGGRFQDQQDKDNPDPFRDFTVATKIVEAVSEEVQGASAFADSPVLRDGIANLITALESARSISSDMEKSGIEAVGMPIKAEVVKARVFPEDNALACLAESAGSVHDLSKMMGRTRDRFHAMQMMLNEAERARAEAESSVIPVNVEKVASSITEELKSVQQELKTTRAQLMSTIDSHSLSMRDLKQEVERLRRKAADEASARQASRYCSRCLCFGGSAT